MDLAGNIHWKSVFDGLRLHDSPATKSQKKISLRWFRFSFDCHERKKAAYNKRIVWIIQLCYVQDMIMA